MPYFRKPSLVARTPGMSGLSGVLDTLETVGKGAITFFGSQQKAAGAAEALAAQNQALINAQANRGGISTETVVIGAAAVGAIAFLLLRKKKAS